MVRAFLWQGEGSCVSHAHTVRGNEGVEIDVREKCGCEMGDGPEKSSKAGNGVSMRAVSYVVSGTLLVWMGPDCGVQWHVASHFVCCQ